MAKVKGSKASSSNIKVTFGKRRGGKAKKRLNKHVSVGSKYRGQGRS
jgi:hypothetical protein